jgi:signal transduction histidine kinase
MLFPRSEELPRLAVTANPTSRASSDLSGPKVTREILQSLIVAQESELSNIARELHDDICQRLAMLSLKI